MPREQRNALLWNRLRDLFDTDDGSLPEVWLGGVPAGCLQAAFDVLGSRAKSITGSFWHDERQQDLDFASHPDAPTLVDEGKVTQFHCLFVGPEHDGETLPDLGASFWRGNLTLDYRMGSEWNARKLGAFVSLIGELVAVAPGSTVDLEDYTLAQVRERFRTAVGEFLG